MSTEMILFAAIGVFVLMSIGIILTMVEFNKLSDEPSQRKGAGAPEHARPEPGQAHMRVIRTREDAA